MSNLLTITVIKFEQLGVTVRPAVCATPAPIGGLFPSSAKAGGLNMLKELPRAPVISHILGELLPLRAHDVPHIHHIYIYECCLLSVDG